MYITNQPAQENKARLNSGRNGKTSSAGESSFEQKYSKTPKAPGGITRNGKATDSNNSSSTAEKYSTQQQQQALLRA